MRSTVSCCVCGMCVWVLNSKQYFLSCFTEQTNHPFCFCLSMHDNRLCRALIFNVTFRCEGFPFTNFQTIRSAVNGDCEFGVKESGDVMNVSHLMAVTESQTFYSRKGRRGSLWLTLEVNTELINISLHDNSYFCLYLVFSIPCLAYSVPYMYLYLHTVPCVAAVTKDHAISTVQHKVHLWKKKLSINSIKLCIFCFLYILLHIMFFITTLD